VKSVDVSRCSVYMIRVLLNLDGTSINAMKVVVVYLRTNHHARMKGTICAGTSRNLVSLTEPRKW